MYGAPTDQGQRERAPQSAGHGGRDKGREGVRGKEEEDGAIKRNDRAISQALNGQKRTREKQETVR